MTDHASVRILSDRLIDHLHSEPAVGTAPVPPSNDALPRDAGAVDLLPGSGSGAEAPPFSQAAGEPQPYSLFDAFTRHRAAIEAEDAAKDAEIARLTRAVERAEFAAQMNAETCRAQQEQISRLESEVAKRDHRIERMEGLLR